MLLDYVLQSLGNFLTEKLRAKEYKHRASTIGVSAYHDSACRYIRYRSSPTIGCRILFPAYDESRDIDIYYTLPPVMPTLHT